MEPIVERHLEALFIPFLGSDFFTIVSNLWKWVAVFTTAVSVWGIKSVGSHSLPTGEDENSEEYIEETKPSAQPYHLSCDVRPCIEEIGEGTTKRKFTMCFEDCDCTIAQEDYTEEEEDGCCTIALRSVLCFEEEDGCFSGAVDTVCYRESCDQLMLVKRSMDLGWYNNQDLTALDGRVVKLWEDDERRRSSLLKSTVGW